MKRSRLATQTLFLLFLTSPFLVNANASDGFILNGMSLSTANELLPSSFYERKVSKPTRAAVTDPATASYVTEEIVVTAPRIRPIANNVAPSLARLFNEIDLMKTQQKEMEWLSSQSNKSGSRVKFGYDPEFEFHNRFALKTQRSDTMEPPTSSVLRLTF